MCLTRPHQLLEHLQLHLSLSASFLHGLTSFCTFISSSHSSLTSLFFVSGWSVAVACNLFTPSPLVVSVFLFHAVLSPLAHVSLLFFLLFFPQVNLKAFYSSDCVVYKCSLVCPFYLLLRLPHFVCSQLSDLPLLLTCSVSMAQQFVFGR